jgi:hypothetical protein
LIDDHRAACPPFGRKSDRRIFALIARPWCCLATQLGVVEGERAQSSDRERVLAVVVEQESALRRVGGVVLTVAGEVGDAAAGQALQHRGLSRELVGGVVIGCRAFGEYNGTGEEGLEHGGLGRDIA